MPLGVDQVARRRASAARAARRRRPRATTSANGRARRVARRCHAGASAGDSWRRSRSTRMPSARASRPVSRPMPPKPIRPSVLPASSRPFDSARARPVAGGDVGGRRVGAAQQQHRRADHVLGDGERVGAGGGNHLDAACARTRRRRCCRARRRAGRRRCSVGAAASSVAVDLRAVAHDQRIGVGERAAQRVGPVDERLVVDDIEALAASTRPRRRP